MDQPLVMPISQWPENWRLCWKATLAPPNSLFGPGAGAAKLRAGTLNMRQEALGVFLSFLQRHGRMCDNLHPADVVTAQTIEAYVGEQKAREILNSTIVIRLMSLANGLEMMFPQQDVSFIKRPGGIPLKRVLPHHPRRVEVCDHRELLERALELHQTGLARKSYARGMTALRDAAITGLWACHGIRSRAFASMELERHLMHRQGQYWVVFDNSQTKMDRSYEMPIPAVLTQVFDDYLNIARPSLGGASTPKLWLSISRLPLTQRGLTEVARTRTRAWTGTARGPHWFRKCITTTVRLVAPELARDAAIVLDHSMATAQLHYDMGTGVAAAQRHVERINKKLQETKARADAMFGRTMPNDEYLRLRRKRLGEW